MSDCETSKYFSVNEEIDELDNFDPSTSEVTAIVGKLKVDNINRTTRCDPTELTRVELNDTGVSFICQNFAVNGEQIITPESNVVKNPMDADLKIVMIIIY